MTMRCLFALAVCLTLGTLSCIESKPALDLKAGEPAEQDLKITYGGFMQNGPQDQLLNGVCGTDVTRNILNCDVHNGLVDWTVAEVTFQVIPSTGDSEQHYYRERLSIPPLQTEHISIRLGMQLPPDSYIKFRGRPGGQVMTHWDWLIVQAKGKPAK